MKVNLTTERGGQLVVTLEDGRVIGPLSKAQVVWDGGGTPRIELGFLLGSINTKAEATLNYQTKEYIIRTAFKKARKDKQVTSKLASIGKKLPDSYKELDLSNKVLIEAMMDVMASMITDVISAAKANDTVKKEKIQTVESGLRNGLVRKIAAMIKKYKKDNGIPPSLITMTLEEYEILKPKEDLIFGVPIAVTKEAKSFLLPGN